MENAASARLAGTVICAIARLAGTVICAIARLAGTESHVRSPGPVKVRAKQCNSNSIHCMYSMYIAWLHKDRSLFCLYNHHLASVFTRVL